MKDTAQHFAAKNQVGLPINPSYLVRDEKRNHIYPRGMIYGKNQSVNPFMRWPVDVRLRFLTTYDTLSHLINHPTRTALGRIPNCDRDILAVRADTNLPMFGSCP